MLPVLDNEAIREADRHTIEDLGVPGLVLMENAATGVVDAIRERYPEAREILILCGGGNNGGDGLAASRHLANGGHRVDVLLFSHPEKLSGDAAENLRFARAFGIPIEIVDGDSISALEAALDRTPDLVVDALLGTGTDRPLAGKFAAAAALIADSSLPVVAVDVPTGLNGSLSELPGPVLAADLTVTFAALKICHTLPPACLHCGDVVVADIGIPPANLESQCRIWWPTSTDVSLMLPNRSTDVHKGTFGHLLIVAGARGRGGAAAMAANAAVASGAGLVTMAVPDPAVPVVDGACLEAMTHAVAANEDGEFAGPEGLEALLDRMTAIVIGPGLGTGDGANRTLEWIMDAWNGPLLLDADAINLLSGDPERLAGRENPSVLTPHPGELGRLLGRSTSSVAADRVAAAREAAERSGSVVVAKGFRTVIADPDGQVWINPTGDSGLASGGSGDVLTGTIGAFLAQGLDPSRAARVGCWLHGRAGELGGDDFPAAVPASRLPRLVGRAWRELEES